MSSSTALTTYTSEQQDPLLRTLGVTDEDEIYESLYNGKSLADISAEHGRDVQPVIDLQRFELEQQLLARWVQGQISTEQFHTYQAELEEIVTNSIYTKMDIMQT
jgi:hypothetical protein